MMRVEIPQRQPIFTYIILGLNIVIFLLDTFVLRGELTSLGAKDNSAILNGQYWRLVTPIFLHVDLLHIAFNNYFLYRIGPQLERFYGYRRFVLLYLLSGITGVLASFILSPYRSIGASGALFGLIGTMIPFLYRNRTILANTKRQISNIIQVIVVNLVIGLLPGIDNWGHVGGLIGGLILGWFITPHYAIHDQYTGYVKIEDQTSPLLTWGVLVVYAAVLGIVTAALIIIRRGSILPV